MHLITLTDKHTLGRTLLGERLACRRDHHVTEHNSQKKQAPMLPAGFESAVSASERPQTHSLDHTATGISASLVTAVKYQYSGF
jgi:hypothetical protein